LVARLNGTTRGAEALTGRPIGTSQDLGHRKAFRNIDDISRQQNGPNVAHATLLKDDVHSIRWCIADKSPVSW